MFRDYAVMVLARQAGPVYCFPVSPRLMPSRDVPPGYIPLLEKTVAGFLARHPETFDILGPDPDRWQAREVGDGNLNLVFIVQSDDGRSLVVKQALPYVRLVGDSWPLPLSRSYFERRALQLQSEVADRFLPKVYFYDETAAAIVMEYLYPHVILRKGFVRGICYPRLAEDLGAFLAQTLFGTSDLALPAPRKRAQVSFFSGNAELCRLTEDFVFTDPYRVAALNRWTTPHLDDLAAELRADAELKVCSQRFKWLFLNHTEALVHGDLHTGSIMATRDDTKVIDPEFAFYGPMGFDLGAVLGNFYLAYFAQEGHEQKPHERHEYREWLLATAEQVWGAFTSGFLRLWRENATGDAYPAELFSDPAGREALEAERVVFMRRLLGDALGFAGMKMLRRIFGVAHVEDLESIEDPDRRARCERKAVRLGRELVVNARAWPSLADVNVRARELS